MSAASVRKLALVLAGGFCGTLARYYLAAPLLALAALALPGAGGGFPFDIFAINLSGAFALGLLYGLAERGARVSPDVRLALGTGFLGAYTTFSTFTVGGDRLLIGGAWMLGVVYLAGSVALGVGCAHLGHVAAGALVARRRLSRGVRVRARRVWRTAFAPGGGRHGAAVRPWLLAHRDTPRASSHAHAAGHAGLSPRVAHSGHSGHTVIHVSGRSDEPAGRQYAGPDAADGCRSGHADHQEEEAR